MALARTGQVIPLPSPRGGDEPGVGKTGIVEGLAQRIASSECPEFLRDARIVEISMSALIAGTKYRGWCVEKRGQDATATPCIVAAVCDRRHSHRKLGCSPTLRPPRVPASASTVIDRRYNCRRPFSTHQHDPPQAASSLLKYSRNVGGWRRSAEAAEGTSGGWQAGEPRHGHNAR